MPSPVGHTLAGLLTYRLYDRERNIRFFEWRPIAAIVLASNAPDLDTAIGLLPGLLPGADWIAHRGPLHSLSAAVLFGVIVYIVARIRQIPAASRWGLVMGSIYASHVVLDFLNADFGAPFGVPLFWPLTDAYFISPLPVFLNIEWKDPAMWVSLHHLLAVSVELAILLPLLLFSSAWRSVRDRRRSVRAFEH